MLDNLLELDEQCHRKVLLERFHLNVHFVIFHPLTRKLELSILNSIGYHPQTQKLRTTLYSILNSTTGKYYSVAFI